MIRRKGISTAVASIAALVTVLAISAVSTAILLGRASSTTMAAAERLQSAEKKIPIRLSTVYHVPPVLMVSNDGTTPLKLKHLYLDDHLAAPINRVLQPGEKVELTVGTASKVAVEVEGYGVAVVETVKPPMPPNTGGGDGGGLTVEFSCWLVFKE